MQLPVDTLGCCDDPIGVDDRPAASVRPSQAASLEGHEEGEFERGGQLTADHFRVVGAEQTFSALQNGTQRR